MLIPTLPKDVLYIIDTLNAHGFEAYIVGGCVRDSLMQTVPKDWDITTSAPPEKTRTVFKKTFDTGIQHGTITVVLNKKNYEITTYRIDGEYSDCRHPKSVTFTKSLKEDLLRRDFTMNAIAYHPKEGYVDPFSGIADINKNIIRGVGEPALRFREDALRMLRGLRFASQLGFSIEEETYRALKENKALIKNVSVERIKIELDKLFSGSYTHNIPLLWESGLLDEIDESLAKAVSQKKPPLSELLSSAPRDIYIIWSIILSDYTPAGARAFLSRLKFDNDSIKAICVLVEHTKNDLPTEAYPLRSLAWKIGTEAVKRLIILQSIIKPYSEYALTQGLLDDIISHRDCLTLKELAVNGEALSGAGVPKGKAMGQVLNALLDEVHRFPEKNKAEILLPLGKEIFHRSNK